MERPSYVAVAAADVVFEGRVVSIDRPAADGKTRSSSDRVTVRFETDRVWKGDVEKGDVYVTTAGTSASCGFDFEKDVAYVVCASGNREALETSLCAGTARMDNAGTLRRALGRLSARGGADMNEEAMALPILDALEHGDDAERSDAAQSLAHLDIDPRPLMSTLTALVEGDDPAARAAAVQAIAAAELRVVRGQGGVSPVPPLVDTSFYVRALTDPDEETRIAAAGALARAHHATQAARSDIAVDALVDAASNGSRALRTLAVAAIAEMDPPPPRTLPVLRRALEGPTSEMRRAGAKGLARMGARGSAILQGEVLARVTHRDLAMDVVAVLSRDADARDESFAALGALTLVGHPATRADALGRLVAARPASNGARALVAMALADSSEIVRAAAAPAARDLEVDDEWIVQRLSELLDDEAGIVRLQAARALGSLGARAEAAVPALIGRLADSDAREARQVRAAIHRIAPDADLSGVDPRD